MPAMEVGLTRGLQTSHHSSRRSQFIQYCSHGGWVKPYHLVPCTWSSSPYIVILHITAWTCICKSEMAKSQVAIGTVARPLPYLKPGEHPHQFNSLRFSILGHLEIKFDIVTRRSVNEFCEQMKGCLLMWCGCTVSEYRHQRRSKWICGCRYWSQGLVTVE
jgi:hypothetical protein